MTRKQRSIALAATALAALPGGAGLAATPKPRESTVEVFVDGVVNGPGRITGDSIVTRGEGRKLLTNTAKCTDNLKRVRASGTIRYGDGTPARTKSLDSGATCGRGTPAPRLGQ